jgi:hypothetical protein
VPLRDARAGLAAVAGELSDRSDGLVDLRRRAAVGDPPAPRLLGSFDPVLLGWVDRTPVVGDHLDRLVAGGIFRPFALVRGRAAAVWSIQEDEVKLEPFGRLRREDRAALDREAADVVRFLSP